ncbi:hypothetical protein QYM36_004814 [Artemia franciscana]|uniref:Uncharacterized protein n=1 Tax=Artemia franciscana TaxID=6661 RepID=A0AA88I0L7_ARTSF|nr:hypothetical protein QYM36_004814 [Artemia franciscana]
MMQFVQHLKQDQKLKVLMKVVPSVVAVTLLAEQTKKSKEFLVAMLHARVRVNHLTSKKMVKPQKSWYLKFESEKLSLQIQANAAVLEMN